MRVYLDNCCYNRPYDDQQQLRISLETQAKLRIQEMIKDDQLELASSYTLRYENSRNPYEIKRRTINQFIEDNTSVYVDESHAKQVEELAAAAMETGVKTADAYHAASAIIAGCDYLLTTDDRLLKYKTDQLQIVDPIEFIRRIGGADDE
ncbi:MAG: PIN domain-containing protein [Oscillospiraceae bacterium]|nr:PIN domain-containing protein [Oscillospiraceae bacterium]